MVNERTYISSKETGGRTDAAMSRRATVKALVERSRRFCQAKLSSPKKHYVIITLVVIDVLGIFTDIAISLVTCEMGTEDKPWVKPTQRALGYLALSIASLFMVELMLCIWAFGHRYVPTQLQL